MCMCKIEVGPKREECKKGVCVGTGSKFFFKLVQKGRNAKRGVGAKRVGAKQFRTWVRKFFS